MRRTFSVLAVAVPLLLLIALVPGTVEASPIFFEEDYRGCGDGNAPSGWTHSNVGTGTIGCDVDEHFPEERPGHGAPVTYNGTESFQQRLTASLIDGWLSPTFSISGATTFSLGLAIRHEAFPSSTFGGAFQFTFRDGSTAAGGVGTRDTGVLHTLDASSIWDPTFFTFALDTWYVVRFDIDRSSNDYAVFINGTQIDANGGAGGLRQTMAPGGGAHDIDEVFISTRSFGKSWIDWVFTDQVTISAISSQIATSGSLFTFDAGTDASSDVIFGLSPPTPAFLSINLQSGIITGTPPSAGTFTVNVTANVSTGQDFLEFTLTVTDPVDPILAWLQTFGPNWVIFLAVVVIIFFLVRELWRGARRSPPRRNL